MAKTLRQETATGFTTKGSQLTWEELDDNFIELYQGRFASLTKATTGSLTAAEMVNYVRVNNLGQAGNVLITLDPIEAGLSFKVVLSTAAAFYYRIAPNASDKFYLDGLALTDGYYVGVAAATVGSWIVFEADVTGTGVLDWTVTTGPGGWQAQT